MARNQSSPSQQEAGSEDDAQYEPGERTRLLPDRLDSTPPVGTGYLSPDDPAVSPYNLWTVRFVRQVTVVLTFGSFLWWVLLLISGFVTPPGLHVRGGGFYGLASASISLVVLVITLLFFSTPSRPERAITVALVVLLLVHLILVLAVPQLRHEEAWTGVAAVAWAVLSSGWALLSDRTVQWGKTEEEERLTGRPETRRTLLEWTQVLLCTIALAVLGAAVILITLNQTLRALDARLDPPGELYWVDGGNYQIHVYCHGNNNNNTIDTPTVLFEAGEDPVERGLWQFADNALKNGSIGRYCFADRPGIAWSDAAPSPLSASIASDALGEALARAGEQGPWVLVSAGIGSLYSRIFSSRHNGDIKAILLIDPLHEDLLHRVGDPGRGFLIWLRGAISPLGLDHLPGAVFRGRNSADRIWGVAAHQGAKTIFAKLQEGLVADSLTKRDVISSKPIQQKDIPLVVVSSGVQIRSDREWQDKQRDLTHITDNLEDWDVVDRAPHRVWDTLEGREIIEKRLKKLAGCSESIFPGEG